MRTRHAKPQNQSGKNTETHPSYSLNAVQLKQWVIDKLVSTEHRRTRIALMDLLEKAETTLNKYCHANHPLLSKPYSLELIAAYLQCDPDMLTEPRPLPVTEIPEHV